MCGGLAPGLEGLCDGGGINRIGHAAEAVLRCPVKFLRSLVAAGASGGRGRLLGLRFGTDMLDGVVGIGGFKPVRWPTGVRWEINTCTYNNVYMNKYECPVRQR